MASNSDVRIEGGTLTHGHFNPTMPSIEVLNTFWAELRSILPAEELHVVDPYLLDTGSREENHIEYANLVATLLRPALKEVDRVVFVHSKPGLRVIELLRQEIARKHSEVDVQFRRGSRMHGRYIVADRSRALVMDLSFNGIGKHFGLVSLVKGTQDLNAIASEIQRIHPTQ